MVEKGIRETVREREKQRAQEAFEVVDEEDEDVEQENEVHL